MAWATRELARSIWADADLIDDDVLDFWLESVKPAIIAYAPAVPAVPGTDTDGDGTFSPGDLSGISDPDGDGVFDVVDPGDAVPENWALAQIMQARNTFNAVKASPSGDFDGSSYGITARPLDWSVKQILRPRVGRPRVR